MPLIHAQVEFVWYSLLRTFLRTQTASGTHIFLDISCFPLDRYIEVSDKSLYIRHFRIRKNTDFLILRHIHHLGRQNTSGTVQCRECLIQLRHFPADGRLGFHNIHRETGIRNIQRGLYSRNTASDYQRSLGYRALSRRQRRVQIDLGYRCLTQNNRFLRTDRHLFMNPGTLLTNIGNLQHIGIQSCRGYRLAECRFVHTRGTGTYDNSGQLVLRDRVLDQILSCLRTHVLIICGENNTRFIFQRFCNRFYIHRSGNIGAAMTDEYSNSLHGLFLLSYLEYFRRALTIACWGISGSKSPGISSGLK